MSEGLMVLKDIEVSTSYGVIQLFGTIGPAIWMEGYRVKWIHSTQVISYNLGKIQIYGHNYDTKNNTTTVMKKRTNFGD